MEKRELTKTQKRFVVIKLISIWLPIICWFIATCSPTTVIGERESSILLLCSLAVSIALCLLYLFQFKKTDGRIAAIITTIAVCSILFLAFLISYIERL